MAARKLFFLAWAALGGLAPAIAAGPQKASKAGAPVPRLAPGIGGLSASAGPASSPSGISIPAAPGRPADPAAVAKAAVEAYAADPRLYPATGPQGPAFHDAELARRTATLVDEQARQEGLSDAQRLLVVAAAALHAIDPRRAPGTLPRLEATLDHLSTDPEAAALFEQLALEPAQVKALVEAMESVDLQASAARRDAAWRRSIKTAFPAAQRAWALHWAERLAFLRRVAPYLGRTVDAQARIDRLAAELRMTAPADGAETPRHPTDELMGRAAFSMLEPLTRMPHYAALPEQTRQRFESTLELFEILSEIPATASSTPPRDAARRSPVKPSRRDGKLAGSLLRADGSEIPVVFDRDPLNSESTFMVTDDAARRFALKTARYVGAEATTAQMASKTRREIRLRRRAEFIARKPGFPTNVKVVSLHEIVELSPELAEEIYGDRQRTPAMLLERAAGQTLLQYLNSGGKVRARDFMRLYEAYAKLHEGGVIHGDVNADNILIVKRGRRQYFTILDFNGAKERVEVDEEKWDALVVSDVNGLNDIRDQFQDAGLWRASRYNLEF